jgi:hypothetical protein
MSVTSSGVIVTAADASYERTLWQMLRSSERHSLDRRHRFVAFDLGMTTAGRDAIRRRFPWCCLELFTFDSYPQHVRHLVSCAWKPLAIRDVLSRDEPLVLWLDCATLFLGSLAPVFERLALEGVFTLVGQSPMVRWCHPGTLACMRVPDGDLQKLCRFGGAVGFDGRSAASRDLLQQWCTWALVEACIDPLGATRDNHRYDQAVLTALLYEFERGGRLRLRDEEVDISSCDPVRWFSTRNKVAPWLPVACDGLSRGYHAIYKAADRLVLRARRMMLARSAW